MMKMPPPSSPTRLLLSIDPHTVNQSSYLHLSAREDRLTLSIDLDSLGERERILLSGLNALIELGLLSEAECCQICQDQLLCQLPWVPQVEETTDQSVEPELFEAAELELFNRWGLATEPTARSREEESDVEAAPTPSPAEDKDIFIPPPSRPIVLRSSPSSRPLPAYGSQRSERSASSTPAATPVPQTQISRPVAPRPQPQLPPVFSQISRMVRSLVAEISVIWLLALGVFLVLLSSGALALTQWQTFPPAGQYGVLWAYTLGFAGASLWTQGKQRLALTSQALRITTILLLPLNLWALDGLGLWRSPTDWIMIAIGISSLGAMAWSLLRLQGVTRLAAILFGILSLLQVGWSGPAAGWIAPYVGVVIGGWGLLGPSLGSPVEASGASEVSSSSGSSQPQLVAPGERDSGHLSHRWGGRWGWGLILYGSGLLLVRSSILFGLGSLGLALLIWSLMLSQGLSEPWRWRVLLIGLGVTWILTIRSQPAQALVISGIGLGICWGRLTAFWRVWDLLGLLGIGAQMIWLLSRLLPEALQLGWTELWASLGIPPWGAMGIWLFPYVWGVLILASWLERRGKTDLVGWSEGIAGVIGIGAIGIGWSYPLLRLPAMALFTLSTGTWWGLHKQRRDLIYGLHGAGILTALVWIDGLWPGLRDSPEIWGILLLIGLSVEWIGSVWGAAQGIWQESAWILGWGLGLAGEGLLLSHAVSPDRSALVLWGAITPGLLVWRCYRRPHPHLSPLILSLVLGTQLLWLPQPSIWMAGLGLSAGLLLALIRRVPSRLGIEMQLGFSLATLATGIWQIFEPTPLQAIGLGIGIQLGLWGLFAGLKGRQVQGSTPLLSGYTGACRDWAGVITVGLYLAFELNSVLHQLDIEGGIDPGWSLLWITTPITLGLIGWRVSSGEREKQIWALLGLVTIVIAQVFWLPLPQLWVWSAGLSAGVGLGLSILLPLLPIAVLQIGFGLGAIGAGLIQYFSPTPNEWIGLGVGVGNGLLLGGAFLDRWRVTPAAGRRQRPWRPTGQRPLPDLGQRLAAVYGAAAQGWAAGILSLIYLSLVSQVWYHGATPDLILTVGSLAWMLTPITLLGLAWGSGAESRSRLLSLSFVSLLAGHLLWLPMAGVREVGLGATVILVGLQMLLQPDLALALVQVGAGGILTALLLSDQGPLPWPVTAACLCVICWGAEAVVRDRQASLTQIYRRAGELWGGLLAGVTMALLTWQTTTLYIQTLPPTFSLFSATVIWMIALATRSRTAVNPWIFWSGCWGIELLTAQGVALFSPNPELLSRATIGLGVASQLTRRWWISHIPLPSAPWHSTLISLAYGLFATLLRIGTLEPWTGITSLAFAWIVIEIGRSSEQTQGWIPMGWIAMALASGEFVWAQTGALALADRVILLSALGTLWLLITQLFADPLRRYLQMSRATLQRYAYGYWGVASLLWGIGILWQTLSPDPQLAFSSFGRICGVVLATYALTQGRQGTSNPAEAWTGVGILYSGLWIGTQWLQLPSTWQEPLLPWLGGISAFSAALIYALPWSSWGWSPRPWRRLSLALPLGLTLLTQAQIRWESLVFVAGFYGLLAYWERQWRWTYVSLGLLLWQLWLTWEITSLFPYLSSVGGALLFIIHVEPSWQGRDRRSLRHSLRLGGLGLILLPSLITQPGGVTIGLSLVSLVVGLALKIRAYLLLGTGIFCLSTLQQAGGLVIANSFSRWSALLGLGLALILGAATFESYRSKLQDLWIAMVGEIQAWD